MKLSCSKMWNQYIPIKSSVDIKDVCQLAKLEIPRQIKMNKSFAD